MNHQFAPGNNLRRLKNFVSLLKSSMKKLKILNLALAIITLLSVFFTPAAYYRGYVNYPDYIVVGITVITLIMVLADKSKNIVQNIALIVFILGVIYAITSAYFYYGGDILYKNYRLKYLGIELADSTIKMFEYLNFFSLVLTSLVEFGLIFVFFRIFLKYRKTLTSLSNTPFGQTNRQQ